MTRFFRLRERFFPARLPNTRNHQSGIDKVHKEKRQDEEFIDDRLEEDKV
jgi:hypothetical protein